MRDNIEIILTCIMCLLFVVGFVLGAIHSQNNKKSECEEAGGVWLPRNAQCLTKEK